MSSLRFLFLLKKNFGFWSLRRLLYSIPSFFFFFLSPWPHSSTFDEFYSKVNPRTISFPQLATGFCTGSGKLHSPGSPSLQELRKKIYKKWGSKSNNTRRSISVSQMRLVPSLLLSVWNRFTVCGEFVPLLALLSRHMPGFMMPLDARITSSPCLPH